MKFYIELRTNSRGVEKLCESEDMGKVLAEQRKIVKNAKNNPDIISCEVKHEK